MSLTVAQRAALLHDLEIFADVAAADLELLASMSETETFAAGEEVWGQGDPAESVHVVVSGTLSVYVPGRDRPVQSLGPGEMVGELAMFARSRRSAAVRAEVETTVLSLPYQRFREFLLRHPEAMLALLERIVRLFLERERQWTRGA